MNLPSSQFPSPEIAGTAVDYVHVVDGAQYGALYYKKLLKIYHNIIYLPQTVIHNAYILITSVAWCSVVSLFFLLFAYALAAKWKLYRDFIQYSTKSMENPCFSVRYPFQHLWIG